MDIQEIYKDAYLGDEESQALILERLKPLILSSIKKYNNNLSEYDDLIQEGRVMILTCIRDYNPNLNVPFLGYIKSRLKYLYLNKNKIKSDLSLNESFGEEGEEFIDLLEGDMDLVGDILKREVYNKLHQEINKLSKREKEVLYDYFFYDLSLNEISKKYHITYRTVLNQKTNALKKLRERMREDV